MGRWEPDARGRLRQAAFELYGEQGYDETTVAEIAARAGLTERTFFRHFADKREVLFAGSEELRDLLVESVSGAPGVATPIAAAAAGLRAMAEMIGAAPEMACRRKAIIDSSAELRERELIKLAALATVLADALRARGVLDPTAGLTAEAAMAVFKIAFERWTDEASGEPFTELIEESLRELCALTAGV